MKKDLPQLPLFYKKAIPLNKDTHSELFIEPIDNFLYTKGTNSIYIAAIEFLKAAKEYPIVFAVGGDNNIFPVVLLGIDNNSNLFINKKGEWDANYIPAYVRRYPFILASENNQKFTVCIDETYPGFNTSQKGKPLFNKKGEYEKILSQAVDFLQDYQNHVQLTTLFCNNLQTLGLLESMQANYTKASGENQLLGGFLGINREKLKALAPEKLAELVKSDQMELIYAHLASMENLNKLIRKKK